MHLFSFFASLLTASAFAIPVDEQQIPFIANAINDERTLVPVFVLSLSCGAASIDSDAEPSG